jgi:hypothetical protein
MRQRFYKEMDHFVIKTAHRSENLPQFLQTSSWTRARTTNVNDDLAYDPDTNDTWSMSLLHAIVTRRPGIDRVLVRSLVENATGARSGTDVGNGAGCDEKSGP